MADIKYAKDYHFSTADVEKILASKRKFGAGPKNYAMFKVGTDMKKKRCMKKKL